MTPVLEAIRARGVVTADGAWGTMLIAKGVPPGGCPELWCLERPEAVREVAAQYVAAGAEIVGTNSFGASRLRLAGFGVAHRAAEINEAAAALSREAAGRDRFVFGSVGPTGRLLMTGEVTADAMAEAFREQVEALARGGADAVCVETMMDIDEARLAVRAAREHTALTVACTFTFNRGPDGAYHTIMGATPAAAAAAMVEAGAHLVGTNCGTGVDDMVAIVRAVHAAAPDTPVLVQANAGRPGWEGGGDVHPDSPEKMAARVPDLIEAGAAVIGGCCGTTPAHVRALAAAIGQHRSRGGAPR